MEGVYERNMDLGCGFQIMKAQFPQLKWKLKLTRKYNKKIDIPFEIFQK